MRKNLIFTHEDSQSQQVLSGVAIIKKGEIVSAKVAKLDFDDATENGSFDALKRAITKRCRRRVNMKTCAKNEEYYVMS